MQDNSETFRCGQGVGAEGRRWVPKLRYIFESLEFLSSEEMKGLELGWDCLEHFLLEAQYNC
jgi:hypothetical protein